MNTKKILFLLILMVLGNYALSQNCSVNAGVDFSVCSTSSITLDGGATDSFGTNLITTWSQVNNGAPSAVISNPNALKPTITGVIGGNVYVFRLTTKCVDGSTVYDDVNVTVNSLPTVSAGTNIDMCAGTIALNASAPGTNESGLWTIDSGSTGLTIANTSSRNSNLTLSPGSANNGTAVLRWTVTNNVTGCVNSATITVTKEAVSVAAVTAGNIQTIECYNSPATVTLQGSYAGDGLNKGGQQGTWTLVSGPNTPSITNIHLNNTTVTNCIQGTYVFRWTVVGTCTSGSADVTIQILAPKGTATAATITPSATQLICDGRTEMTLVGSTPKIDETVTWSGPAALSFSNVHSPTTLVTGLGGTATQTITYTITCLSGCMSTKTLNITYGIAPSITVTSPNPKILACDVSTTTITFTKDAGVTGAQVQYSVLSGPVKPTGILSMPSTFVSTTTTTSLTLNGLTAAGTYVVRLKKTPGAGSMCDAFYTDVSIVVSKSPSASNAGTGQNLVCHTLAASLVGSNPTIGSGTWSQVSGPNTATISSPTSSTSAISNLISGTYIFRWLISGGLQCPSNQSDVSVKVASSQPTTSIAGSPKTICYSSPLNLEANSPASNETGTWTVSPSVGVTFSNINSPTAVVTGLAASTVYTFTWTISNACGNSASNVLITTSAVLGPIAANAGSDQCKAAGTTSTTMAGNSPSPGTGLWSQLSGTTPSGLSLTGPNTARITDPTLATTTLTGLINGTYYFQWAITQTPCSITTVDTVMITISAPATTAVANTMPNDTTLCGTSKVLSANTALVGTGTWSQIAGSGDYVISDIHSPTATLSNLKPGLYIFRWTIATNGGCSSSSSDMKLYVSTPPPTADAGLDKSICGAGTSVNMAATSVPASQGSGFWTLINGPNTPVFADQTSPTTQVSGLINGTYTLRWTVSNGLYCTPSTDDALITVVPTATGSADQTKLCGDASSVTLTGNSNTTGTWTQVGTTPSVATIENLNTSGSTALASGLTAAGTYSFHYTINASGCSTTSANVNVVKDIFSETASIITGITGRISPTYQNDTTVCNTTQLTLKANASTATKKWTLISGPNTPTLVNSSTATATVGSNTSGTKLITGTYVYEWKLTSTGGGTCTSSQLITIKVHNDVAATGGNQSVCGTVATMNGTAPVTGVGVWTQVGTTPNVATITSPSDPRTTITGLIPGVYTFNWAITDGPCTTSSVNETVTVTANPVSPNAGTDQNLYGVFSTNLAPLSYGSGTWSQVSGPNTATGMPSSATNPTISGLVQGTYTFRLTETNGTCSLTDDVLVNVYNSPSIAIAGADTTACLYSPINLTANVPSVGTGTWSMTSGPSTVIISNPTSYKTSIIGIKSGTYTFRWTIMNGVSDNTNHDEVNVTVYDIPTMAVCSNDKTVRRSSTTTTISANKNLTVTSGTGEWTKKRAPATAADDEGVITNKNSKNTSITNIKTVGTYVYVWKISSGTCFSEDSIKVFKKSSVVSNRQKATPKL